MNHVASIQSRTSQAKHESSSSFFATSFPLPITIFWGISQAADNSSFEETTTTNIKYFARMLRERDIGDQDGQSYKINLVLEKSKLVLNSFKRITSRTINPTECIRDLDLTVDYEII